MLMDKSRLEAFRVRLPEFLVYEKMKDGWFKDAHFWISTYLDFKYSQQEIQNL